MYRLEVSKKTRLKIEKIVDRWFQVKTDTNIKKEIVRILMKLEHAEYTIDQLIIDLKSK